MNNRMNKEELIELINSLNLDNSDYCVLSSSSLVIREIYPDAGDLDLAVNKSGFEKLKKSYNLFKKDNGWYIVNEKVECVIDENEVLMREEYDSCSLQNINNYYNYLKGSNREKDKLRISLVEDYINKNS